MTTKARKVKKVAETTEKEIKVPVVDETPKRKSLSVARKRFLRKKRELARQAAAARRRKV